MAAAMLRTLSVMTVVGPVPRGPAAVSTASAPVTAGRIDAGSMTSAVTTCRPGCAARACWTSSLPVPPLAPKIVSRMPFSSQEYSEPVTRMLRKAYHTIFVSPGGRMSSDGAVAGQAAGRGRGRLTRGIRESLRDMGAQLSRLNHEVGGRLNIRTGDLECLDHIGREGPLSPTSLARLTGQHPATLTGILDRLERGGWIARERDPDDRRSVV